MLRSIISVFMLSVLLLSSVLAISSCTSSDTRISNITNQADIGTHDPLKDVSEPPVTEPPVTEPPVTEPPVTEPPVTEPVTPNSTVTADKTTDAPAVQPQVTPTPDIDGPDFNVGKGNTTAFNNSLFIGDSRTVGLSRYGDLGSADVFATTGMNVFRVFKETVNVPGHGAVTLDSLLSNNKYSKIYIMLGLNEIGYNADSVIKTYAAAVSRIREKCPDATLVICANLHIVNTRSVNDSVYNNTVLNRLNDGMKSLADGRNIVYVDVNPLFDDKNGALRSDITVDDFHLKGKYYGVWSAWLSENS